MAKKNYYCSHWGCDDPLVLIKSKPPRRTGKAEHRIYKCPTCNRTWKWHGDDCYASSMTTTDNV